MSVRAPGRSRTGRLVVITWGGLAIGLTQGCWGLLGGDASFAAHTAHDAGDGAVALVDAGDGGGPVDASTLDARPNVDGSFPNDAATDSDAPVASGHIAAARDWACALLGDAGTSLYCWGGPPADPESLATPAPDGGVLLMPTAREDGTGVATAFAIAAKTRHACRILSDRRVGCWGDANYGKIGNTTEMDPGSLDRAPVMTTSGGEITDVEELAVGNSFSCARDKDASVFCWGDNDEGDSYAQLTTEFAAKDAGTFSDKGVRLRLLDGARQIALGWDHGCAVLPPDGNVQCWGRNDFGQSGSDTGGRCHGGVFPLPTSTTAPCVRSPSAIPNLTNVRQLALGRGHSCALTFDGRVLCWGRDGNVDLGASTPGLQTCTNSDGDPTDSTDPCSDTPQEVPVPSGTTLLASGEATTCALNFGEVFCWGRGEGGALGRGTTSAGAPAKVLTGDTGHPALSGVVDIGVGYRFACALKSDGSLYCWGTEPGLGAVWLYATLVTPR